MASPLRLLVFLPVILCFSGGLFAQGINFDKPNKNRDTLLQSKALSQGELGELGPLSLKVDTKIAAVKEYHLPLLPRLERASGNQKAIVASLVAGKKEKAAQIKNVAQVTRALEQVKQLQTNQSQQSQPQAKPQQSKLPQVKALLEEAAIYQDKTLRWAHRPELAAIRAKKAGLKIKEAIKLLQEEEKKKQDKKDDSKKKQEQNKDQKKKDSDKSDQEKKKKDSKKSDKDKSDPKDKKSKEQEQQQNKKKETKPDTQEALDKLKEIRERQKAKKKRIRKSMGLPSERPKEAVDQDW
ncbi:MAG: hypothetical protein QNL04_04655 [SAR324 cluster bacterium]|nr:hypothetical protein [SAR324 cluster bacterium]